MTGITKKATSAAPLQQVAPAPRAKDVKADKAAVAVMPSDSYKKAAPDQPSQQAPAKRLPARAPVGMGNPAFWNSPATYRNMASHAWWANPNTYR